MALALYRKYRPATFAEVVGQEHVTEPLRVALTAKRVNHAYLFSGPRGCGKTSSARILARSLNCEQGPTADPCGVCDSCISLAPEGPGNVDVVELDAASHGGVDDARELRDRAFYAPASSRYRVFIIDEAHMVTTQGFNALLKIVEEPPEHLVFIFATTEPDKVLPTIRSRTHHYPFRLIPPSAMRELLERNVADEGATVAPAVYPLVIRAGGGSARDTQSVLDQLLAGAGPEGVTYERAVALLGVTDVALIDEMVDGLAAGDASTVYGTVDKLVEAGHDPRRFAADLLDRLRDLVLLRAVPEAGAKGLVTAPGDELDKMITQAQQLGPGTLTRFAEIVHNGLVDMRGATAPRLLLELLCARMLLPGAVPTDAAADSAVLQRLERIERRVTVGGSAPAEPAAQPARPVTSSGSAAPTRAEAAGQAPAGQRDAGRAAEQPPAARPAAADHRDAGDPARPAAGRAPEPVEPAPTPAVTTPEAEAAGMPATQGGVDAPGIRRLWSELLAEVRKVSRSTEAMLTNASVQSVEGNTVTLGHIAAPLARRLAEGRNVDAIAKALEAVFGGTWQVRCVHADPSAASSAPVAEKPKVAPTFQRPTQAAAPPRRPEPAPEKTPEPRPTPPVATADDEPLPPEPPEEEDYDDGGPAPDLPPASSPEEDMVKLLTDKLGARPLDR
ncbi:DNA polymerase III subunit gamma and tau [Actinophytocola xanthii]|uniref:DNA polymerase III subunit gamma/tau n=1 Tax=Actinophytocola xanthii TaxID=1912961 RepID=A0A1Q8CNE6_9PSEU|nr:DNA polymerase III subunit gamma and tau [Actinophytocola xanthii]OLF15879.1 DNA polymerase III subunit gamma/tau [Actinophytocola xanthii]